MMNIHIFISYTYDMYLYSIYVLYIVITSHLYTVAGYDYELLLLPSASVLERTVQLLMWI